MTLNIVFSVDQNEIQGVLACINSIVINTKNLNKIEFYILTNEMKIKLPKIGKDIYQKDLSDYPILKRELEDLMSKHNGLRINNISNFARFLIPYIFSEINEALYMDADMIVNADIYNILDEIPKDCRFAACANYDFEKMGLKLEGPAFNAGIYYWNFKYYLEHNFYHKVKSIMQNDRDKKKQIKFGTQHIVNILYHGKTTFIDNRWNVMGFGALLPKLRPSEEDIKNGYVYHWTGDKKPWLEDGNYRKLWLKYKI